MTEMTSSATCVHRHVQLRALERFGTRTHISNGFASALRSSVSLVVLTAVTSFAWAQESSPSQSLPSEPFTMKVSVDMVVLRATVQDRKNTLVSGLSKDDFQVYEDGVLQTIKYFSHEDIPVTVGLVIDNSGSMKPKLHDVVSAALVLARSSNPQDQMFVVNFNERVSFGLPENIPFTDQVASLEVALSTVKANGETALYDAVAVAIEHLKKGDRDQKVLIVISDGGDNASKHKLSDIMALAGKPDVIIYTIGIFDEQDSDRDQGVLKRLAKNTGGAAFLPASLNEVAPVCERIAHDIRSQYIISYVPTNRNRDGNYRVIQVKANAPGRARLLVRTRTGYFAPAQSQPSPAAKVDQP